MQYDDAAQAQVGNDSDAVLPAAAPSGSDTGAPPAGSIPQTQRDLRAQVGREIAAANRRAEAAERQAAAAMATAQEVLQSNQSEKQAQWNAYLDTLPPAERAVAELRAEVQATRNDVASLRSSAQPRTAPSQQISSQEIQARKDEILDEIANETGVRLSGQEHGIDDKNELAFRTSAYRTVALQANAQRNDSGETAAPGPGRPASPRPISGALRVTEGNVADAMWSHDSTRPWEARKHLRELREEARKQAGVR